MKRKLIKQTLNDWRSNLWLALELLVVSVVVWYTVDFCYVSYVTYHEPLGFEIDHCYKINMYTLNESSPEYTKRDRKQNIADKLELLDRITHRPEVEVASFSNVSHPYNLNNAGQSFSYDTLTTEGFILRRMVTPEFFKVFKCRGANGETPEELASLFTDGSVFVSSNLFDDKFDIRKILNDTLYANEHEGWEVKCILPPLRMSEYAPHGVMDKTVILKIDYNDKYADFLMDELCVRVRDNMDKDFIANIMADAPKYLRVGNLFIGSVESFDHLRDSYDRGRRQDLYSMLSGMAFLLVNVFLGLFGTFWFRTQQRVSEIAIRKVNGATRGDIFRRFIGEGIVILSAVTLPAILLDAVLAHFELNTAYGGVEFFGYGRIIICAVITFVLLALMIVCGIAIPAWRAMKLNPAEALHDE